MRRFLFIILVLCLHGLARGQTGSYNGYYWFDSQQGKPQTSPVVQGSFDVDASALADGIHSFHFIVAKDDGGISLPAIQYFVKTSEADTAIKGYYWFDDETDAREASVTNGTFEVDASSLSDGFHRFNYVALQENGVTSMPSTCYFLKTAQVNPDDELTCICSVDGQLRHIEKLSQSGGILHWNLDMQDLADGVHQIQLQAVTPSGAVSNSYCSYFMRITSTEDLNEMYCVYAIDGNSLNSKSNVISQNGSFHFDLDLSELEEGLHYISFMLHSDRGTSTAPQLRFFVKTPLGGNGITQYQYWLNDDDINQSTIVTLPEKVNPLQLMSLLPVESRPLRSSQFHFDISSGKPMIYAKNTIHLRFHDIAKRFSDVAKEYVDYSKSCEVEPVGKLQTSQTFMKVAENDIRWYTMHSAPGDTVSFKLSQPATIQLFAPSGKEVFNTSGSASVRWSGIHTWEDGTYYLAVHDVTGSQENMTLEYMHMDKYDVVDWDVHTVGNGGCSTITFKGNGFRDLYTVDLVVAPGDTIQSVYISHDSDAETEVAFDFTSATLGEYDAVFHFTEEDKPVANVVTVEEAVDIELATTVTYPSMFLQNTPTTYTIKITNKGNMTAYCVPIDIRLRIASKQDISEISFSENLESFSIPQELRTDSLDEDVRSILYEEFMNYSDLAQFMFYTDSLENIDYGLSQLFLNIRPNTTETFTITIKSASTVSLETTVTKEWIPVTAKDMAFSKKTMRIKRESIGEWMCCYRQRIECIAEITANILGILMPPGANCATSTGVTVLEAMYDIWCSDGNTAREKFNTYLNNEGKSLARKLLNSALSCVIKYFDGYIKDLRMQRTSAMSHGDMISLYRIQNEIWNATSNCRLLMINIGAGLVYSFLGIDCLTAFFTSVPNCPPKPGGGGGVSRSVISYDPNDIFGYLSEAGSKFIADSVAMVNYTIEFENDTTFAEASAHTIVIKDTLDSNFFDFAKFLPTGIRIGKHEVFLNKADVVTKNNVTSFVKTIDMRPEINAIAQVDGTFSHTTGVAEWRFTSLDPMTMEPTDDLMQGILPVNYNGISGIGEVMFEVGMKQGKADGTELKNRAGIVFDYEEAILTPTWTNIVDAVAPSSIVDGVTMLNDSTLRVFADANDARSGVWKYEWYIRANENAPWWKEGETYDGCFDYHFFEGIDYGFCVVVTDSAGNRERKELQAERIFKSYGQDYEDTIEEVPATAVETEDAYDVSGRKVGRKAKGVIIRHSDGTTRKVLTK